MNPHIFKKGELPAILAEADAHMNRLREAGWTRVEFATALRCTLQHGPYARYYLADYDIGGNPKRLVPRDENEIEGEPEALPIEEALTELCLLRKHGMNGYAVITESGEIIAEV